jgi:hypothetical protein
VSIVVGTGLVLLGIVVAELWHWARGERAASEASYFRETAGSLVAEIVQQREQAEAAMRRAVQQGGRRNDA